LEALQNSSFNQLKYLQPRDPQYKDYIEYHKAMCEFVDKSRHELNYSKDYKPPAIPNKSDFIKPSLQEKMNTAKSRIVNGNENKKDVLEERGR